MESQVGVAWALIDPDGLTNLWLIRLPDPVNHHWYMHYGLYPYGLVLLYGMTYYEALSPRAAEAPSTAETDEPVLAATAA